MICVVTKFFFFKVICLKFIFISKVYKNLFMKLFNYSISEGETRKKWLDILTSNGENYNIKNHSVKNDCEELYQPPIQLKQSLINRTDSDFHADISSLQQYAEGDATKYCEYDLLSQYPLSESHITQHSTMTLMDQTGKILA